VETVCVRVRLKPGSLSRVRAWAAELTARREEVPFKEATFAEDTPLELLVDFESF
jgi:hypothetical protein